MKIGLAAACAASILLAGAPAFAQTAPAPTASAQVSDADVQAMAKLLLALQGVQEQAAMAAAVEKSGLSIETYNSLATLMGSDTAFAARVQKQFEVEYTAKQNQEQAQAAAQ